MVAVRIRPLSQKERVRENVSVIATARDDKTVVVYDPTEDFLEDILRKDRQREKYYVFDHVFSETASQATVFEHTVKYLIDSVLHGFNATVFAYGATGAGKTYTMMGTETNPGIMVLTLADLFSKISADSDACGGTYDVVLSYLEIYNENIRDLLSGKPDVLELREDANRGVVVAGITYVPARSPEEVLTFLRRGNKNRSQEATGANEVSSRSHAVLQVFVTYHLVDPYGQHIHRFAKLSMIDLAGSERAAETNNRGMRMIEGANINRSLLALGNCINALIEPSKKNKYVNYRDSKLTRLLKDSLGGNCRTVMIANISPSSAHFDETLNTLKYASRARTIKTKITQQVVFRYDPVAATMQQLQTEINRLKPRVELAKDALPRVQARHGRLASTAVDHDDVKWMGGSGGNNNGDHDTVSKNQTTQSVHMHQTPASQQPQTTHPQTSGRQAPASPDHTIFREIHDNLEVLFTEQLDLRTKLLDADESDAEFAISLAQKQSELLQLDQHVSSKDATLDRTHRVQIDEQRKRLRATIQDLIQNRQKVQQLKSAIDKQMQDIDDKIKTVQQTMPKQVERRTRQYLSLQTKAHYLEMDNLDLDLNYALSRAALKQKMDELQHTVALLDKYRELVSAQKGVMDDNKMALSTRLKKMYDDINALERSISGNGSGSDDSVASSVSVSQNQVRMQSLDDRIAGRGLSVPGTLVGGTAANTPMHAGSQGSNVTQDTADANGILGSGLVKILSGKKTVNMDAVPTVSSGPKHDAVADSVPATEQADGRPIVNKRKSRRDESRTKMDDMHPSTAASVMPQYAPGTNIQDNALPPSFDLVSKPTTLTQQTSTMTSTGSYAAKNKGSYARQRQPAADTIAFNSMQPQRLGSPLKQQQIPSMQVPGNTSMEYPYARSSGYMTSLDQQPQYFTSDGLEPFPSSSYTTTVSSTTAPRAQRVQTSYAQQPISMVPQIPRRDRTNPFVPQERRSSLDRRRRLSHSNSLTTLGNVNNGMGVNGVSASMQVGSGGAWQSRSEKSVSVVAHNGGYASTANTQKDLVAAVSASFPVKPKTPRVMPVLHSKSRASRSSSVAPEGQGIGNPSTASLANKGGGDHGVYASASAVVAQAYTTKQQDQAR